MRCITDAIAELGDDLDAYDRMRDQVREMHDLGLIRDAINGEREYQEAQADMADAKLY